MMSEIKIPATLLNLLSDINAAEIKSHIYDDERLKSWLCSWHEAVKNELYDFYDKAIDDFIKAADKHCGYYAGDKHCGYYAGECRNLTRYDLICIANNMKLRSDG